ncbi:MAG TPA: hypothetical protein VGH54_09665 [Mycobacterium sp.]|jgi:hypothetical protein|uniref:hypothetical protein n=1 Tax=Mycobacterium sp. TaxID=1785 RepID=UPI002F41B62E
MATINELERVAAMAVALRPDWVLSSVLTNLKANHGTRPFRDLAVAVAWIATDPDTLTPGRLLEAGPWWEATTPKAPANATKRNSGICDRCRYPHPAGQPCDVKRDEIVRDNPDRIAAIQQARAVASAAAHGTTDEPATEQESA